MTDELAIGDRTHSSWSMRGGLLFSGFNIPVRSKLARMYTDEFERVLKDFAPARLVPAAKIEGRVVWDTLAIAETLHERHPEKNMWPVDPVARAMARAMVAEMHSGFFDLREECTMNLEYVYTNFPVSDAVTKDITRIEALWEMARSEFGQSGPWLFGEYSIADVFYAPVATRFTTYALPRGKVADAYIQAHLHHTPFRQWRAMGRAENYRQEVYQLDFDKGDWPVGRKDAKPIEDGSGAKNDKCPYSGDPVTHFLELDGAVYGFCNAFCRDKTVADPEAWPAFIALTQSS